MEVVEIISFHINRFDEILEVTFRTNYDTEDLCREAKIPFLDISDFGYNFHDDVTFDDFDDDDYYDEFEDDDLFVDESEIISFLNEYFVLFTDKLPKAELF